MDILIIDRPDVRRLLPMTDCIAAMEGALRLLAENKVVQPLRSMMRVPRRRGIVGMMPACTSDPPAVGIKIVTVFPGNHGTEFDSHQGAVMLFDPERGTLTAVVEAGEVTAIRTAAVSAVATRLLAKPDAGDLAILGSGVQARQHLEAMAEVRSLRRVRVWSPTAENREAFARRHSGRFGASVESASSAQEAVEGADLICTTTFAKEPILMGDWIAPGAHINAVGSSVASARELDTAAVVRSSLYVDRIESALKEAGDYLIPQSEGAVDRSHIRAEIGDVLCGRHTGRTSDKQITLFKSLGLGVEDVVAVEHIYQEALRLNAGTSVPFGGPKDEG